MVPWIASIPDISLIEQGGLPAIRERTHAQNQQHGEHCNGLHHINPPDQVQRGEQGSSGGPQGNAAGISAAGQGIAATG